MPHTHARWLAAAAGLAGCVAEPFREALPERASREDSVLQSLVASEYAPIADGTGVYATNRAHDLRVRFTTDGVSLSARTRGSPPVTLSLSAFGRASSTETLPSAPPALGSCDRTGRVDTSGDCLRQVRYERAPGLFEWWENRTDGLQQGFTVERRPGGEGDLALVLDVRGATLEADGPSAVWLRSDAQSVRYAGLAAWDERGSTLPARIEVRENTLRLLVDDRGAAGAVTIDPVLTTPSWSITSTQADAQYGISVASAGDVDGDGEEDILVGADRYDNGQTDEGMAFLYLAKATAPSWTAEGDQANAFFGASVASAGDVNGDGYSDVLIGAPGYDNGQTDEGRAFLYLGSPSGLAAAPAWTAEADQGGAQLGLAVSSAGDVDGDGDSELLVGAPYYDGGQSNEGRVLLYLGSPAGPSSAPSWSAESDQVFALFGSSVATAGDVNGDGYSDVLIGAHLYENGQTDEGRASLYTGSASGLSASPSWTLEGNQVGAYLGGAVSGAGDVNGDGYADVLVGAYGYNVSNNEGRVWLHLGSASGPSAAADWFASGLQPSDFFGWSLSATDLNSDGYSDVIIGATGYNGTSTDVGRVSAYFGSAQGLSDTESWAVEGTESNTSLGQSVCGVGRDVLAGAPSYVGSPSDFGAARLYEGFVGVPKRDAWYPLIGKPTSLAAGDVNGDGYDDVIVSARHSISPGEAANLFLGSPEGLADISPSWRSPPEYDGLDLSVITGDVNGDGYGDLIVGDPSYSGGQTSEGRISVYTGSPQGLSEAPVWSEDSNRDNARLGLALATGDVNGDGRDDLLVGALDESSLYLGSADPLALESAWAVQSEQLGDGFGSVLAIGDVDEDGYADLLVGAPEHDVLYTDEGAVSIYLGSPLVPSTTPAWVFSSEGEGDRFGAAIASCTFDGYADVLIGIPGASAATLYRHAPEGPGWLTPQTYDGAPGSSFGASIAPVDERSLGFCNWLVGSPDANSGRGRAELLFGLDFAVDGSDLGGQLGYLVASAGDVSGDGYGELLIADGSSATLYTGNGEDNGAPGLPMPVQTRQPSSETPITSGLTSESPSGFDGAVLFARGPWGRGKVRLQLEIKPAGVSFNGSNLISTPYFDSERYGINLQPSFYNLLPGKGYHWRVRVQGSPVSEVRQISTPWRYPDPVYTQGNLLHADLDGDWYGDPNVSRTDRGGGLPGYVTDATDCDDTRSDVNPGALEVCDDDNADEDCDTFADDADSSTTGQLSWYTDGDEDGYGSGEPSLACDALPGTAPLDGDCDETRSDVNPAATERCDDDNTDEDCDSLADDADDSATEKTTFWLDADNDGYGSLTEAALCDMPEGYAPNADDCADTIATINPGAQEVCDPMEIDEDCDSLADDADDSVSGQTAWYEDNDGDSFGAGTPALSCELVPDRTTTGGDCDDSLASVNPQATESPGDSIDSDCDGTELCFADADNDGQRTEQTAPSADMDCLDTGEALLTAPSGDCDDDNPDVHSGAAEIPGDGLDSDCDSTELCFVDADLDGYRPDGDATVSTPDISCSEDGLATALTPAGDCDDSDPSYHPSAPEDCADPADYNCDSASGYADLDGDGYAACEDCDDNDPARHPGAEETEGDGIDSDCDGLDPEDKGCGCAQTGPSAHLWPLLALVARVRRLNR